MAEHNTKRRGHASGTLCRMRNKTLERPNHCKKDKGTEPFVRPASSGFDLQFLSAGMGKDLNFRPHLYGSTMRRMHVRAQQRRTYSRVHSL